MSKKDNLTDFLTDIANAMRGKQITSGKINPQNFAPYIRSAIIGRNYQLFPEDYLELERGKIYILSGYDEGEQRTDCDVVIDDDGTQKLSWNEKLIVTVYDEMVEAFIINRRGTQNYRYKMAMANSPGIGNTNQSWVYLDVYEFPYLYDI